MNEHLQQVLKENFGYDSFRGLQEEIIQTVLNHQDCLAILPTGTGKSLCYQLPGCIARGNGYHSFTAIIFNGRSSEWFTTNEKVFGSGNQ